MPVILVLLAGQPVTKLPIDRVKDAVVRAQGYTVVGQTLVAGAALKADRWRESDEQNVIIFTLKRSDYGDRIVLAAKGNDGKLGPLTYVELLPPSAPENAVPKDALRFVEDERHKYGKPHERAEILARETLPATDPLPAALASSDPLRVIEARLMLLAGERRARLAGAEARPTGRSLVKSIALNGAPKFAVSDDGSTLYAGLLLTVAMHLVRDENGVLQEKDVVCAGRAELTKYARGAWKLADGSSYDIDAKSCVLASSVK